MSLAYFDGVTCDSCMASMNEIKGSEETLLGYTWATDFVVVYTTTGDPGLLVSYTLNESAHVSARRPAAASIVQSQLASGSKLTGSKAKMAFAIDIQSVKITSKLINAVG